MAQVLIDTCIAIDHLRGRAAATAFLAELSEPPALSAISIAELYAGVRDGRERLEPDGFVAICMPVPVTPEIAREAGLLRRRYHRSHGLDLADALIAASALAQRLTFVTLNRRHFPMLEGLLSPY